MHATAVLVTIMVVRKEFPPTVLVSILVVIVVVGVIAISFARRRAAYIWDLIV